MFQWCKCIGLKQGSGFIISQSPERLDEILNTVIREKLIQLLNLSMKEERKYE